MHEFSVASALLDLVEERARKEGASRVLRVEIRVGEHAGVVPELLASAWELVCERSDWPDAALVTVPVPARWACPRCDASPSASELLRCARCDLPARLVEGAELMLDRIEMEVT